MKRILAIAFLLALFALSSTCRAASQSVASLSASTCGDDICSTGEDCDNCIWDCGVCNDTEGSGGSLIGTKPAPKTVRIWDGVSGYHDCPLSYSSYVFSGGINTSVRFRILNNFSTSTGPFRLSLSSSLSWFVPKNITFSFGPDGYTYDGKPFWDVPGLGPNESTEVSFTVNGSVGLIDKINVNANQLARWTGGCKYFVPVSGASLAQNITGYLDWINQSQNVTIYYENENQILTHLEGNHSFAVFGIYSTNVTPILDRNAIERTVSVYTKAASPRPSTNTSKPFEILNYSRTLKQGPEKSCMMITGMDRFNCTDRTSCRYACASVPVCWYIGQIGWPFIDTLLDYRKTIDKANETLDRAINSSLLFSQSPSYGTASAALYDLKSLNRVETAVAFHPLFTKYNFCPPPEYAIPQQIEAKRQLLDYLEENCVKQQESRMVNESFAIAPKLKAAEPKPLPVNVSSNACINQTTNMTGNFTANMTGNITCNLTANATANITGNATGNMTANVTTNVTANVTTNMTANATTNATSNFTGNATGNVTANVSSNQSAGQSNATIVEDEAEDFANEIRGWIEKNDVCSGVSLPLSLLFATFLLRNRKEKKEAKRIK